MRLSVIPPVCLRAGISLLALTMPLSAHAADEAADEDAADAITVYGRHEGYVVHSASSPTKTDTPLINVPQAVAVLNRKQMDDQAVDSLVDALRYVPGVVLGQGEGHRDQVTLRGQNSTADFFLDGLRDDAQYYRPLYNTERVEVLKGANAMIFGRGGGGGVINRVAKAAEVTESFGNVSAGIGSWGDWTVAADANLPISQSIALRLNATHEDLASHRDAFDGHFTGIAPTLGWEIGEATKLSLGYEYGTDRRVTDRGIPSVAGKPMTGVHDQFFGVKAINHSAVDSHIVRTRLDHAFSDDLSANLTAQFANYDKYYANIYPRAATATTAEFEGYLNTTQRENWIIQGNLVWHAGTGIMHHTMLAGFEVSQADTDDTRKLARFGAGNTATTGQLAIAPAIAFPSISFSNLTRNSTSVVKVLSAYVQDQLEIGEHVQIVAGLRHDDFHISSKNAISSFAARRSDTKWSPRMGLIIKPRPNISVYASHAISFLPQSGEQFTVLDATTASLAPEKFRNIEAGLKWDFTPEFGLTAAVYQLDRTNTRATNPLNGQAVQTGKSRAKGFEISLAGRITPELQASIGYANQQGEVRATTTAAPAGRKLAQLPRHQFSAWARYDFTKRIGAALGLVHQSAQYATISNAVRLPGFTRLDAALFFAVTDRVALQINAENLTDKRYYPSAHTDFNISTGEPLNIKATARVKF